MANILIGIPARYASTRLPGKPLAKIAGKEMIARVWEIAKIAASKYPIGIVKCAIATEDERILNFCREHNMECHHTSVSCETGTDRVAELIDKVNFKTDFVVNLQGDNPSCPPWFLTALIDTYLNDNSVEVVTPCVNLTWETYERLKQAKRITPYSGTTVIVRADSEIKSITEGTKWDAVWFSKSIIPVIRKVEKLKEISPIYSPVLRHIGLYSYRQDVLRSISQSKDSIYGSSFCEGLEQLKFIEIGKKVKVVKVNYRGREVLSGVDTVEDLKRTEAIFEKYGEFDPTEIKKIKN